MGHLSTSTLAHRIFQFLRVLLHSCLQLQRNIVEFFEVFNAFAGFEGVAETGCEEHFSAARPQVVEHIFMPKRTVLADQVNNSVDG